MKYLGIDYGEKRVGVAVSDDAGRVAFAKATLPNDRMLMTTVTDLLADGVEVVIGESKAPSGADNPIMVKARAFAAELERAGYVVHWEPEYYTSVEARRNAAEVGASTAFVDAEAAAIILTSYLNRINGLSDSDPHDNA